MQMNTAMHRRAAAPLPRYGRYQRFGMDAMLIVQIVLIGCVIGRYQQFFPGYESYFYIFCFFLNIAGMGIAIFLAPYAAAVAAIFWSIAAFFLAVFAIRFGTPISGVSLGTYAPIFTAGLLGAHLALGSAKRTMAVIYLGCLGYLLIYLYIVRSIDAQTIFKMQMTGQDIATSIVRSHAGAENDDAGYRVFNCGFFMAYAMFYPAAMLPLVRGWRRILYAALAIAAFVCLWLADFRFNLICVFLSLMVGFVPIGVSLGVRARAVSVVAALLMTGLVAVALLGANFFQLLAFDASGMVRVIEAEYAMEMIPTGPIFGTGLFGRGEDWGTLWGSMQVAPSDIGWYGVLLQYGIMGCLIQLGMLFAMAGMVRRLLAWSPRSPEAVIMLCCLAHLTVSQVITTVLWDGGGAIAAMLAIVFLLSPAARRSAVAARRRIVGGRPGAAAGFAPRHLVPRGPAVARDPVLNRPIQAPADGTGMDTAPTRQGG